MINKRGIVLKDFLFLHFTVLIFSLSLVANKFASNFCANERIFSPVFLGIISVYAVLTVVYAVFWQINLEKYKLSFLYMNRAFYMVWTQIFAIIIFNNEIHICNVIGIILIILGVVVNSRDV